MIWIPLILFFATLPWFPPHPYLSRHYVHKLNIVFLSSLFFPPFCSAFFVSSAVPCRPLV
ncbi:hypothetical protein BDV06DRAFT_189099 [Aspergillus oleicola]